MRLPKTYYFAKLAASTVTSRVRCSSGFKISLSLRDSLPLGHCLVTVTGLEEDDVSEAKLHFDEEASRPSFSARIRRGLRDLADALVRR